jgi:hypothetical protein
LAGPPALVSRDQFRRRLPTFEGFGDRLAKRFPTKPEEEVQVGLAFLGELSVSDTGDMVIPH